MSHSKILLKLGVSNNKVTTSTERKYLQDTSSRINDEQKLTTCFNVIKSGCNKDKQRVFREIVPKDSKINSTLHKLKSFCFAVTPIYKIK